MHLLRMVRSDSKCQICYRGGYALRGGVDIHQRLAEPL
jgi:hypothetical protein